MRDMLPLRVLQNFWDVGFVTTFGPRSHQTVNMWELEHPGSPDRGQGQFMCGGYTKRLKNSLSFYKAFCRAAGVVFFFLISVFKFSHSAVYSVRLEMAREAGGWVVHQAAPLAGALTSRCLSWSL